MYKTYVNPYYNPTDTTPKPGDNQNWEDIQRGFYRVGKAIEETAENAKLTRIDVSIDTTAGIVAELTNIEEVAEKIGHFNEYPQYLMVTYPALENREEIAYPGQSVIDGSGYMTAFYTSVTGSYEITQIDDTTWGVTFTPTPTT